MEERIIKNVNNLLTQIFQKMKEAGYEWDEKTHELKKIEPSEMVEALRTEYEKGRADAIAEMKKPADVMDRDSIDDYAYQCAYCMSHDWIKDTASWDDVQIACKLGAKWYEAHHKVQWSEEDERMIDNIIFELEENQENISGVGYKIDWLKSLRPQKQWKPSDKQMEALHDMNLTGNISYAGQGQILIELYNDLKKLTE